MLEMAPGTWTVFCKGGTDSALLPMTHAMTRLLKGTLNHINTQPCVYSVGDIRQQRAQPLLPGQRHTRMR